MKGAQKQQLNINLKKPKTVAKYGTAGYRLHTDDLNNVLCRASLIAYVRSATFAGKYIGLYITASHNPIEYNGIKFVDFNGNMLDENWELASDELVNCEDSEFHTIINRLFRQNSNYSGMSDSIYGNVIIGRDTRESGVTLTQNIKEVLTSYRCNVYDYGEVSCPEMHFLIRKTNENNSMVDKSMYIQHMANNFEKLINITENNIPTGVDTAYGISGIKMADFTNEMTKRGIEFDIEILNEKNKGVLNKDCGADYVKTTKSLPKINKTQFSISATFDGDMDRLLFYKNSGKIFDGDAQCAFVADYLKKLVDEEKIDCRIGAVLSYYSNMGAIEYLKKRFEVVLAQTGVKNFVREAKKFDIGIYFEPNGHGSVMFSKKLIDSLSDKKDSVLKIITEIFDPCIGDGLANFLFFKATVKSDDELSLFNENPSRLLTVKIKDKHKIKVDQKNSVLEPNIQKLIDQQAMSYKGRSFVRPSGTEDLVRVYAEAPNEAACDKLALSVAQIVYDNCDGIGNYPEINYQSGNK